MITTTGPPERHPPSGIDVLVVGGGLGGLVAAVELYRHGHDVRIIESKAGIEELGDFVGIAPSATRQFNKWPGVKSVYKNIVYRPALALFKHDGELIGGPFSIKEGIDHIPTPVSRPKLIKMLFDYVQSLGIPISFGKVVVDYYEIPQCNRAGVLTDKGEHIEADLVIAADGVASKSWKVVSGEENKPKSSGFSVFRVAYPTELIYQDPFLKEQYSLAEGDDDICQVFLGKNTHGIVLVSPSVTTWFLTHKDKGQAAEQWNRHIDPGNVVDSLDKDLKWDKRFLSVIQKTPPKSVVDYKILWRNPNPTWSSPNGLVLQLGDSAHSFLPTSANGATQAMEDGISIAACLSLAGKANVALATRVHTRLRFRRVSCAQRSGFKNREKWHHTDFEAAKKNPESLVMQVGKWINLHDPEQYVYDNWAACVNHLVAGAAFEDTNTPPGYTYSPWTIDELLQASAEGRETVDEGDWS